MNGVVVLACAVSLCAQDATDQDTIMAKQQSDAVTVVPVPSGETRAAAAGWQGGRDWHAQHADCVALAQAPRHDLVLLGDSITQSFGGPGRRTSQPARVIFDRTFAGVRVANMGISGDRTQHLLWRLENGALSGPGPAAYFVAIGTNNIGTDDPRAIAAGIEKIVRFLRTHRPESVVMLCPVLPRGFTPEDSGRKAATDVNDRIRALEALDGVWWVDCEGDFLEVDGALRRSMYGSDGLHLDRPGYTAWGLAITTTFASATGENPESEHLE